MKAEKQKERIGEEGLEHFEEYIKTYSQNREHPGKIILNFYKGNKWNMFKSCLFLIAQRSPIWVLPIVTANIINIATDGKEDGMRSIIINLMVALIFICQNAPSNYFATKFYARVNRSIEGSLRNALVRKLQHLSIMFHKEMQSGRLQSKIMRDVENVQDLLTQIFKTLLFLLWICLWQLQ